MPLLNTATKVYAGTAPAVKVYAGTTPVWASVKVAAKLVLPGVALNYLSAPPTDLTSDIEITARVAMADWKGLGSTVNQALFGRYNNPGGQRSFLFRVRGDGFLLFAASTDGSNATSGTNTSSVAVPFTGNVNGWVRCTYATATGTLTYYTAADAAAEPSSWTALGTARTLSPTGAVFNPAVTVRWQIGDATTTSANPLGGRVLRVILRNGIGGPVLFDVNEDNANANIPNQFTATSGQVVTQTVTAGNQIIQPRVP